MNNCGLPFLMVDLGQSGVLTPNPNSDKLFTGSGNHQKGLI
jgi:hypothetical protein